jgi:hypothetical protein
MGSSIKILPGGWIVFSSFLFLLLLFCVSEAAAWPAPASVGCGSLSLHAVLRFWNQLCNPPTVLLWSSVFHCAWLLGACVFASLHFSGAASSLLSVCCDGLLFIFQFCCVVWLCVLLTGSGDELCGPLPALFQTVADHMPALGPSAFPAFVYMHISSLLLPSSPMCF